MSPLNPSTHPYIYCDLSPDRTERGFSLERTRSIEDFAKIGLTLESAVGLKFVFADGDLYFNGVVIHDPELGYLATNEKPTEAELLKAKASSNKLFHLIPVFLSLASLSFVLTLLLAAWGAAAGARNLGGFVFNGCAIGAVFGLLSVVLSITNYIRNDGRLSETLIAIFFSLIALCIHLPIVVIAILVHYNA
jgi:hypothetical protein